LRPGGCALSPRKRKKAKSKRKKTDVDRYKQPHLEIFDVSSYDEEINTIKPGDCMKFLRSLKKHNKIIKKGIIIFDNDADGLFSGVIARNLLRQLGYKVEPKDLIAVTHLELPSIKHDDDKIYFYVDIQPKLTGKNVYCVDHHVFNKKPFEFSTNNIIYSPENIEREFPTTCALLVIYLNYIQDGGLLSFVDYINNKIWAKSELTRLLVLLCAVADNLWLLSKYSEIYKLRDWIKEFDMTERKLIKLSMAISILLGRQDEWEKIVKLFTENPLELIDQSYVEHSVEKIWVQVDNLYKSARTIGTECEKFIKEYNESVAEDVARLESQIKREKDTIGKYRKAMPVGLRHNTEAIMEMLDTIGDRDKPKWKQIEFYGLEIERLTSSVANLENRLDFYREKQELIAPDMIPGICLFITKQSSGQVKGIMSSLLYYFGFRNIVIEEFEHHSVWGARGFSQEDLESELTTLSIDKPMIDLYRNIEDFSKALPKTYQRSLNISQNVTFEVKYKGGMGGRGKIYGGNIIGKVPLLFALLESETEKDPLMKIRDLIKHGQFTQALKGLTEGESKVPTSNALKSKFKIKNWVTVQVMAGSSSGDILLGDLGMVLGWLAGRSREFTIRTTHVDEFA
jgi:hypothetical protein